MSTITASTETLQAKLTALAPILRGSSPSYNEDLKEKYLKAGKAALLELAKVLGVDKDCVRVNRAGIAVAGDVTLHTDRVYLQLSDPLFWGIGGRRSALIRSCSGRKDYSGGVNQWLDLKTLADADALVAACERVAGGR